MKTDKGGRFFRFLAMLGLAMLLTVTATAQGIKERIVFYDETTTVNYAGNVKLAVEYFTAQGFKQMDTVQLLQWLKEKIAAKTCVNTVVLQVSDVMQKALVEPWDKTSLLYRYCEEGGRWVAPTGNALYAFESPEDITPLLRFDYRTNIFGIRFVYGLTGVGRELTDRGKKWCLDANNKKWLSVLQAGVLAADVIPLVQSTDGKVAFIWQKNVNPAFPDSGLVGCTLNPAFSGTGLTNLNRNVSGTTIEMIYQLCVFSGESTPMVPLKDWRKKNIVAPDSEISFVMECGGIPRKAYQRGETIPLRVKISENLKGQEVLIVLRSGAEKIWKSHIPVDGNKTADTMIKIETTSFRCGEYALEAVISGKKLVETMIYICPARRNNPFPLFICKGTRANPFKEKTAQGYCRENNINPSIFDLSLWEGAANDAVRAQQFGEALDLLLQNNLMANARISGYRLFTTNQDEKLVLYDGSLHAHGQGIGMQAKSIRAFVENYLEDFLGNCKKQVELLRQTQSPAIVPYFYINDDASMFCNYDFNPLTLAEFQKRTGLTRTSLPELVRIKEGNNVFIPQVEPGVVKDDHPWLQYFRYHCNNYDKAGAAEVASILNAWPGSLIADTGCAAGPLYVPRGFYAPLSHKSFNTTGFYGAGVWPRSASFNIEASRLGNRNKPLALNSGQSYTSFGAVNQKAQLWRVLSEAPTYVFLWNLDNKNQLDKEWGVEQDADTWLGTKAVGGRIAGIAEFMKLQKTTARNGALLYSLAQNCFNTNNKNFQNYAMTTALENFRIAGAAIELLSTEEIMEGRLSAYKVVFINQHQWISEGEKKALEEYIVKGGAVVVDANTTIEIKGAIKADGPFGEGINDSARADRVALCSQYVGKYLPASIVQSPDHTSIISVNAVGNTPLVWVIDPGTEIENKEYGKAMNDSWDSGVYKYLKEKSASEPFRDKTISVEGGYVAYDLWAHGEIALKSEPSGRNSGVVSVEFLGATPVVLLKDKINDVTVQTSNEKNICGDTVTCEFVLQSERKVTVKGIVPAQVTVYAPDGKEAWEYGGNALFEDGVLTVRVNTAVNDAVGNYKVMVKELCSGKSAETVFILQGSGAGK